MRSSELPRYPAWIRGGRGGGGGGGVTEESATVQAAATEPSTHLELSDPVYRQFRELASEVAAPEIKTRALLSCVLVEGALPTEHVDECTRHS